MPRRRQPSLETLDDLLHAVGMPLGRVADAAGIEAKSLFKLRRGLIVAPRIRTVASLARALGVEPQRVRSAIAASRAAAGY